MNPVASVTQEQPFDFVLSVQLVKLFIKVSETDHFYRWTHFILKLQG